MEDDLLANLALSDEDDDVAIQDSKYTRQADLANGGDQHYEARIEYPGVRLTGDF